MKSPKGTSAGGVGGFSITIRKQPNAVCFPLQVQPTYKISQIKQRIYSTKGIPIDDIKLSYNGTSLDDPKATLTSLGIKNRNIVDLAGFTVYVRTPKGKKHVFNNIDVETPIEQLKQMVSEKDGTPIQRIGLYFNKQVMQNGFPISKYKVRNKNIIELKYDGAGSTIVKQKEFKTRAPVARKKVAPSAGPPLSRRPTKGPSAEPTKKKTSLIKKKTIPEVETIAEATKPAEGNDIEWSPPVDVNVTIVACDGSEYTVTLDNKDNIGDLRRKAAKKVGAVLSDFYLTKENGEEASVDNSYKITDGDKLYVSPLVSIHLPDKTTIKKPFPQNNTTIADVKAHVSEANGYPVDDQILLGQEGEELEDDTPIGKDFAVRLRIKEPPRTIAVISPDEEVLTFVLNPEESADDLWQKVAEAVNMTVEDLQMMMQDTEEEVERDYYLPVDGDILEVVVPPSAISVVLPNGDKFELEAPPTTTIRELKEVLEEETGTPVDEQCLFFLNGHDQLDDDKLLSEDMDLRMDLKTAKKQQEIDAEHVEEPPAEEATPQSHITVQTPDGKSFTFDIDPDSSAMDVRKQIADKIELPIRELRLSKDGAEELKKGYMPSNGDLLTILPPRIAVKTADGRSFYVEILPEDTATTIREKIANRAGIPSKQMSVIRGNETMPEDYMPSDGDELRLRPRKITVKVADDGSVFQLTIEPDDTADSMRKKIAEEAKLPMEDLRLSKNSERLDSSYMPIHGDVLTIEPPTATLTLPDGSSLEVSSVLAPTVGSIKDYVSEKNGTKRSKIKVLNRYGKELEDEMQIENDYGSDTGDY